MLLYELAPGQSAKVIRVIRSDRRLRDLGLIEGTQIKCRYRSPLGDPTAYDIRGAVVALRQRDARKIIVEEI